MSINTGPGVTSIAETGDTPVSGAIEITEGSNMTITRSGNAFTFASSGGAGAGDALENASGVANHPYVAYFGPCLTNLVPNPKFHANITDGITSVGGFTTISRLTSDPFVGVGHARLVVTASGAENDGLYFNNLACSANSGYVLIAWVKSNTGTDQDFRLRIVPDVSAAVQSPAVATTLSLVALAGEDYVPYVLNIVTGASDTNLDVAVTTSANATAVDILIGGMMLVRADITAATDPSYAHAYFDGDFAGCSWSGTANNSSSSRTAPFSVEDTQDAAGPVNTGIWLDRATGSFQSNHIRLSFPDDQAFFSIAQGGPQHDALGNPAYVGPYYFYIDGTITTVATGGRVGAIMRVENYADGIVAMFAGASTTQDIVVIDAGSLTSGAALSIFSPEDKQSFADANGKYFVFTGKGASSTRPDYTFGPEKFLFGVATETLNKQFKQFGGGMYKRTETDSGRTASKSGTTITKTSGSDFNTGSPTFYSGDKVVLGGDTYTILTVSATTITTVETGNEVSATLYLVDVNYSPYYAQMEGAGPADHRKAQGAYGLNNFYIDSGRNPRIGFPERSTSVRTCSGTSGTGTITLSGAESNATVGNWIVPYGHEQRQIVAQTGTTLTVVPSLDSTIAAGTAFELIVHTNAPKPDADGDADPLNVTFWVDKTMAGPSSSSTETSLFGSQPMLPSGSLLVDLNDRNRSNHTGERTARFVVGGDMVGNGSTLTLRFKIRTRGGSYTTLCTNVVGSIPGSTTKGFTAIYEMTMIAVNMQKITFHMVHDDQFTDHIMVDSTSGEIVFDSTSKEIMQDGNLSGMTAGTFNCRPDVEFDITAQWSSAATCSATHKFAQLI